MLLLKRLKAIKFSNERESRDLILVIDNDRSILQAFENVLRDENYTISTSARPEDALNLVLNIQPEVVILDVKINEQNGIKILNQIKKNFPDLPVFIMTAYSNIITRKIAFAHGADEYFIKPFEIDQLLKKLKELIQT
jgi:DNA-binding response OmpR family regulator